MCKNVNVKYKYVITTISQCSLDIGYGSLIFCPFVIKPCSTTPITNISVSIINITDILNKNRERL